MTVIAFKDGIFCADTLTTVGEHRCYHTRSKIAQISKGFYLGYAGAVSEGEELKKSLIKSKVKAHNLVDVNFSEFKNISLLCVTPGPTLWFKSGDERMILPMEGVKYWAIGSGWQFAVGAMAVGATAEEAVYAALLYDTNSGTDKTFCQDLVVIKTKGL